MQSLAEKERELLNQTGSVHAFSLPVSIVEHDCMSHGHLEPCFQFRLNVETYSGIYPWSNEPWQGYGHNTSHPDCSWLFGGPLVGRADSTAAVIWSAQVELMDSYRFISNMLENYRQKHLLVVFEDHPLRPECRGRALVS